MTDDDFRIEHDSMGDVRVPKDALWRAQTQRAVENFPLSGVTIDPALIAALGAIKAAAATVNAELGVIDGDVAKAIADAADEVAAGKLRRPVPDRRLPDRLRHLVQHEHQRGHRHPGHRPPRSRRPPQRPRQRLAVLQRRLPVRDPRRGHPGDRQRPDPGAAPPRGVTRGAQGRGVGRRRQERPHPPDGRHAGHPGPGVRRLRRQVRYGVERLEASLPASASCRSAAPRSAPASTPRPDSPRASSRSSRRRSACRSPRPATTSRRRARATPWSRRAVSCAPSRSASTRSRTTCAGCRPARPPGWARSTSRTCSPARRSCRARSTRSSPEAVCQVVAQVIGNDAAVAFGGAAGQLRAQRDAAGDRPQPARVDPAARQLLAAAGRPLHRRHRRPTSSAAAAYAESSPSIVTPLNRYIGYENAAKVAKKALADGMTVRQAVIELGFVGDGEGQVTEAQLDEALDVLGSGVFGASRPPPRPRRRR